MAGLEQDAMKVAVAEAEEREARERAASSAEVVAGETNMLE